MSFLLQLAKGLSQVGEFVEHTGELRAEDSVLGPQRASFCSFFVEEVSGVPQFILSGLQLELELGYSLGELLVGLGELSVLRGVLTEAFLGLGIVASHAFNLEVEVTHIFFEDLRLNVELPQPQD